MRDNPFKIPDLIIFFFLSIAGFGVGLALVDVFAFYLPDATEDVLFVVSSFVIYFILFTSVIYIGPIRYRYGLEVLGFQKFRLSSIRRILIYLGAAYGLIIAYSFLFTQIGIDTSDPVAESLPRIFGESTLGLVYALIVVAFLAPVVEETIFRGFLFSVLRKFYGLWPGAIFSSLIFAAFHLNFVGFIPIFVIGMFLAFLYEREKSLYPPILLHMANNALTVSLVYYYFV